jgi:hypothetical protein
LRWIYWLWWIGVFAGVFAGNGVQDVVFLWSGYGELRGERGELTDGFLAMKIAPWFQVYFEASSFLGAMPMMTIGHSTLEIEAFLRALRESGCRALVDVRRYPGSKRYPQFGQERLFASLAEAGIRGVWRVGLGGRRAPQKDSVNTAWKNESFRGYADYMQTPEFAREIDWLMGLEDLEAAVVMCAEAVPWRCHRSLIGDAVLARGGVVEDLFVTAEGEGSRRPHGMTEFARVESGRVWYPKGSTGEAGLFG